MAKRKKGAHRRRRVGALNMGSPLVKVAAVAAGYFLGDKTINPLIDKVTAGKVSDKVVGIGQTGLGALLLLGKGRSGILKTAAGGLLAGSGLKRVMASFGTTTTTPAAVTGYQNVPVIGRMGGYQNVPVIGAYSPGVAIGAYTIPSGNTNKVMGSVGCTDGSDLLGSN